MWKSSLMFIAKYKVADSALYKYGIAFLFTFLALVFSSVFWPTIDNSPFLFFVAAVVISAWLGGFGPGMFSAALAIVLVDYFLIEPVYSVLTSWGDMLQFLLFSLISLLIGWLEEHRKRSAAALKEVHDELNVIINSVVDGVTAQDAKGKPVFANAAAARLTGYPSPETLIATPITSLQRQYVMYDTDNNLLSMNALPRHDVFRTGHSHSLTFKMIYEDDHEERWIDLTSVPVFGQDGEVKLAVNIMRDITQNVVTQHRLSRYEAIVQNSWDAIIGKDLNGIVTSWNPGAEHMYGYSAWEMLGKPISLLFPDELMSREVELLNQLRDGQEVQHYETQRVRKDKVEITISLTISPIYDSNNRLIGYSTIERDITEKKRLTQQLEQEKRKLLTIFNTIPGIVYESSNDPYSNVQQIDFVSQYAEKMLGYPLESWKSVPNFLQKVVVHPDDREDTLKLPKYEAGVIGPVPFRCITQSGETLYVESYNAVIKDFTGKQIGTCGLVMNITDRKKHEQEVMKLTTMIEQQRQRLEAIIRNIPGIIFENTYERESGASTTNFISDYTMTMLGYEPKAWLDDPDFWQKIVEIENVEAAQAETLAAYEEDRRGSLQFRCRHASGEMIYAESFFNFNNEGPYIRQYGVIMDISKRRQTEEIISEYMKELRRSNEELEQFAYVASHDLQEPLRMVTSYLQLIEQRYAEALDESGHEFIAYAVDGAARMKSLINDLLAYSRIQRSVTDHSAVNMQEVLDKVLYNLQISIEDSEAIITSDKLPEIKANEGQMVQLLQNLISNGIKFCRDRRPEIHIGVEHKRHEWQFSVRDNGIGIEETYKDRIFIIFQRLHTRQDYPGTGIGLAICRKIVEKHHGRIWIESVVNEGTTFFFTIPTKSKKRAYIYDDH